jgi:hypothetical protein
MITDSQFKTDREAFIRRLEEAKARDRMIQAVYDAHMSKAAHHLYLAGEAVKRAEFGYAESQHGLAAQCVAAAIKSLPNGNAIGAASFGPVS